MNIEMPTRVMMVCSAIVPIFLSFVIKFVHSKKIRMVIGYGASVVIGVIGAFASGASPADFPFLIATAVGIGYLAYKKFFKKFIDKIEGSGV